MNANDKAPTDPSAPLPIPASQPPRPSPVRAATLAAYQLTSKSRASSQPAGERFPVFGTSPNSGRDSPLSTGGKGGSYGVIGGARTPSRFSSGLPGPGTATRANSFSVAESGLSQRHAVQSTRTLSAHPEETIPLRSSRSRSKSPFPTFSPTSSRSASPRPVDQQLPDVRSPPLAEANVSRSRSQSLAGGPRMTATERNLIMPMSALADTGAFSKGYDGWSGRVATLSTFASGASTLFGNSVPAPSPDTHTRWLSGTANTWTAPAPDASRRNPLSASLSKASGHSGAGQMQGVGGNGFSTQIGGFENSGNNANRSGSSSRRHSVSVVAGPGGLRDVFGGPGSGMSQVNSGRGLGQYAIQDEDLWPEQLNNALSLEIDSNRRRGIDIEQRGLPISQSLPRFDLPAQRDSGLRASVGGRNDPFSSDYLRGPSPARGRPDGVRSSFDRVVSGDSNGSKGRSGFELVLHHPNSSGLPGPGMRDVGYGNPYRGQDEYNMGNQGQDPRWYNGQQGFVPPYPGGWNQGRPPYQNMGPQNQQYRGSQQGYYNHQGQGYNQQQRFQPQQFNSGFSPAAQPFQPGAPYQQFQPPHHQQYQQQGPPINPPTPDPNSSPSFSQLSLADLGKGIPLVTMNATTPLYIVAFKAGRRDVYYCPDPTQMISNGDWVIVEADRGSDLGTVVYDQLSAQEIREWQEAQATAALMSGASVHQPPGMAAVIAATPPKSKPKVLSGDLAGTDLNTLLQGVGPGGQAEINPTNIRGPLAKEIMPKRIFAKSSQGPEDQVRMADKVKDENEALAICREKAEQRGLAMTIVDAEYQWDRRKLTFYFKADRRVDFRDLTKENFRIFKSRIWMSMVPRDDPRN